MPHNGTCVCPYRCLPVVLMLNTLFIYFAVVKQKLLALELMNVDELIMPIQELKISAPGYIQRNDNQGQRYAADVMGQRCNSFEQSCDGIQEQKNGGAQEQGSDGCGGYGNSLLYVYMLYTILMVKSFDRV